MFLIFQTKYHSRDGFVYVLSKLQHHGYTNSILIRIFNPFYPSTTTYRPIIAPSNILFTKCGHVARGSIPKGGCRCAAEHKLECSDAFRDREERGSLRKT